MKNVNKKGLCQQAKIARHKFAYGKAFSCCFCRCWGLNFGYDDGQMYRIRNCNVGIRFSSFQVGCGTAARFLLGVYGLRKVVFLTGSRHIPCC